MRYLSEWGELRVFFIVYVAWWAGGLTFFFFWLLFFLAVSFDLLSFVVFGFFIVALHLFLFLGDQRFYRGLVKVPFIYVFLLFLCNCFCVALLFVTKENKESFWTVTALAGNAEAVTSPPCCLFAGHWRWSLFVLTPRRSPVDRRLPARWCGRPRSRGLPEGRLRAQTSPRDSVPREWGCGAARSPSGARRAIQELPGGAAGWREAARSSEL